MIPTRSFTKSENSSKPYHIQKTGTNLYIKNLNSKNTLKIKRDDFSFEEIPAGDDTKKDLNSSLISFPENPLLVDAIIGIIEGYDSNSKYLLYVSSSELAATIEGKRIFRIVEVDLIKIIPNNKDKKDSLEEQKLLENIKKLFSTKNFYYANYFNYDLSMPYSNEQQQQSNSFNINNNDDYLVNSNLLKYFKMNKVSKNFFCNVILGYVGSKKRIKITRYSNSIMVDNIIIERINKNYILINTDTPENINQIEYLSIIKNNSGKKKIFSHLLYKSNESILEHQFFPWNEFIESELTPYSNIECYINDQNIKSPYEKEDFLKMLCCYGEFENKIKNVYFTSLLPRNVFLINSNNNNNQDNIDNNKNNEKKIISSKNKQDKVYWLIDVNNHKLNNDFCFNIVSRIFWNEIRNELKNLESKVNDKVEIGELSTNNFGNYYDEFKELIIDYHNDIVKNKKSLYKYDLRENYQEMFNYLFDSKYVENEDKKLGDIDHYNKKLSLMMIPPHLTMDSMIDNINNRNKTKKIKSVKKSINLPSKPNSNNEDNINNNTSDEKLNVLCVTWNVGGKDLKEVKDNTYIQDLFAENSFGYDGVSPDIIVISLQEIIELGIGSVLTIVSNDDIITDLTHKLFYSLYEVFNSDYSLICKIDLVGILLLCLVKRDLASKISLVDTKIEKFGFLGTMGNKGFAMMNLDYKGRIISFVGCHLVDGKDNNKNRIEEIKKIFDTEIKLSKYNSKISFKDLNYWFIIGDTNSRVEGKFKKKDAVQKMNEGSSEDLFIYDQLSNFRYNQDYKEIGDLINEGYINFNPTYKLVCGGDEYDGEDDDEKRIPSWTDRIIFSKNQRMKNIYYDSIQSVKYSDHRPVVGCFEVYISLSNNEDEDYQKFMQKVKSSMKKIQLKIPPSK